jgi:hypothetical protein
MELDRGASWEMFNCCYFFPVGAWFEFRPDIRQALEANVGIGPLVGRDRCLPPIFQLIIHR